MSLFSITLVLISAIIHASWNLLVRTRSTGQLLLRIPLLIAIIGLAPALWQEWSGDSFSPFVWQMLALTAIFQSLYYWGLLRGYQQADFSMVYSIVRALPMMFIAVFDALRGNQPTAAAWSGMALVSIGCLAIPHTSLRNWRIADYGKPAMFWVLLAALGAVGYSTVDKLAAEAITPGALTAARYYIYESGLTALFLWGMLRWLRQPTGLKDWHNNWPWALTAAVGVFLSYWLILWVYQVNAQASYVVAIRQFSIVIGAIAGVILFREPAPGLRIAAASTITLGVLLIAWSR
jgi:drug/metabolite transporter (DMT)-like permease